MTDKSKAMAMVEDADEAGEAEAYVPRTIFTRDAKPDLAKMQIPQLRLAQGLTQEVQEQKAVVGQYVLANFGPLDEVTIVPMAAQHIREYKPDPRGAPACKAPTGDFGIGNPGGVCVECPLSKWGPKSVKTGKSTKPPCTEGVVLRGYSLDHRCVVDFQFKGRSMGKGQFIMQQAMAFGYGNFAIKMDSSQTSNQLGKWVEPTVEMMTEIPEGHVETAAKWFAAVEEMMVTADDAAKQLGMGSTE